MRTQKRKCDLPPKLRICLITNNEAKQAKGNNSNTMVQKLGSTDLDLKDYARLHTEIHCQTGHQGNIMCYPLVVTILTQCHVSKGLKVFGEPG